jgi:hypothetical protein
MLYQPITLLWEIGWATRFSGTCSNKISKIMDKLPGDQLPPIVDCLFDFLEEFLSGQVGAAGSGIDP